ncbi:hypothetical protein [Telmatospirillum sp.]|uniref:hypothetical protein n=1 Tax=Telmatospirillum sp. TaxID=2079197 RepID=UPI00284DA968|nr:hypothetical protein [Telmatospirillum sp.]MDR3439094.1 hypothetical protein [Telmatospirillum sp.]
MIIFIRSIFRLLACLWLITAGPARAAEIPWLSFDALGASDRTLAEGVLAGMFGDDPDLWPDWLNPGVVLLQAGGNRSLMVVREPYRAPCGQYLFVVFGPAAADGNRQRWGDGFCAGDLTVIPVRGSPLPDLLFAEGHQQDPADGTWHRADQRVRWTGTGWVRIDISETQNPFGAFFKN